MGIEYNMYDRDGKKIMTYRNAEHTYGEQYGGVAGFFSGLFGGKPTKSLRPDRYRVELFKSLIDEFRKDFKNIQDDFKKMFSQAFEQSMTMREYNHSFG